MLYSAVLSRAAVQPAPRGRTVLLRGGETGREQSHDGTSFGASFQEKIVHIEPWIARDIGAGF